MKELLTVILAVLGGLGTFLLGMKHLSEGLQAVSGKRLRKFMALATTHRLAGIGTGVASTIIVQSSSIITVMVVGFVSSGILNLSQAINIIIGSNIGTTATAWIIAFAPDVGMLGLGIISIGAIMYFFVKGETVHNLGLALLGLGFVFMGLYWIKEGVEPIKSNPAVVEIFKTLDAKNLAGLLKCTVVSLVFTAVVQSSAATTAIAMVLANQGLITFEAAAATVFGMNIGTTITAWMAAMNATTEAKRTAMAHTLFNVAGTLILVPLFLPVVIPATKMLFPNYATAIPAPMAAVHTFFNVMTTAVFLPFVKPFAHLVERMVPVKTKETPRLTFLNPRIKMSPIIALNQVWREITFMSDSNLELFGAVRKVVEGTADEAHETFITKRERILDFVQKEITEFIGHVMTGRLPVEVADRARMMLRLADEYESISDEAPTVLSAVNRLVEDGQKISDITTQRILAIHDSTVRLGEAVGAAIRVESPELMNFDCDAMIAQSRELKRFIQQTRKKQLARLGADQLAPLRVLAELDIMTSYDRMRECYENISQTLAGGKDTFG